MTLYSIATYLIILDDVLSTIHDMHRIADTITYHYSSYFRCRSPIESYITCLGPTETMGAMSLYGALYAKPFLLMEETGQLVGFGRTWLANVSVCDVILPAALANHLLDKA